MSELSSLRSELRRLGDRRKTHAKREDVLNDDIQQALTRCQEAGLPLTEAADLLGMERSTLYRSHLPKPQAA